MKGLIQDQYKGLLFLSEATEENTIVLTVMVVTDGRIKLKWIFEKWNGGAWTVSIWLRIGTGGRLF
jgi:hypothetical protein